MIICPGSELYPKGTGSSLTVGERGINDEPRLVTPELGESDEIFKKAPQCGNQRRLNRPPVRSERPPNLPCHSCVVYLFEKGAKVLIQTTSYV